MTKPFYGIYLLLNSFIHLNKLCFTNFNFFIVNYYLLKTQLIGLEGRVFANGLGDQGSNPRLSHTNDFKNGTWYLLA